MDVRYSRASADGSFHQLGNTRNCDISRTKPAERQLVGQAAQTGQALFIGKTGQLADQRPGPFSLLLAPVLSETGTAGVLELFFPEDYPEEARKEILHYAEQMAGYASVYLSAQSTNSLFNQCTRFWDRFEPFLLDLHNGLDSKLTAFTAANDARQMMGVDRVSVVSCESRSKLKMIAVSGQDAVNRRANVVRLMMQLVKTVLPANQVFFYDGRDAERTPQVANALGDYLQEAGSRMVMIVPLYAIRKRDELRDKIKHPNEKNESPERKLIGAMIFEQMNASRLDPSQKELAHLISDHTGAAIGNAKSHEVIFLLPRLESPRTSMGMGENASALENNNRLSLLAIITLLLIFLPWSYRVEGTGRLMPVIQRNLFAPESGKVKEIYVQSAQVVKKGDPLILLTNKQLESSWEQTKSELSQKKHEAIALRQEWAIAYKDKRPEEALRIEGEKIKIEIEIKSLAKEEKHLQEQVKSLTVRAPIDGVIVTFQLKKNLRDRPVNRGDVLLEVMDPTGDWRLELIIDDKRMGHLLEAREKNPKHTLPVEYILATKPEQTYIGSLSQISTRTNVHENEGNVVELFVVPSKTNKLPEQRIGAEVKAKIDCGKRSLGYVLFGDVVDFLRIRLWL